jgi:hypothetical protein
MMDSPLERPIDENPTLVTSPPPPKRIKEFPNISQLSGELQIDSFLLPIRQHSVTVPLELPNVTSTSSSSTVTSNIPLPYHHPTNTPTFTCQSNAGKY